MVSVDNYKADKYYPKVVSAFDCILTEGNVIAPVEVFIQLGNLDKRKYEDWRCGRASCLESVIAASPSKLRRILRIIAFHAHDLSMGPSPTVYKTWGKGKAVDLKFTNRGGRKIEDAYSKCFVWKRRMPYPEWKQTQGSRTIATVDF